MRAVAVAVRGVPIVRAVGEVPPAQHSTGLNPMNPYEAKGRRPACLGATRVAVRGVPGVRAIGEVPPGQRNTTGLN